MMLRTFMLVLAVAFAVTVRAAEQINPGTVDLRFDAGTPIVDDGGGCRILVLPDGSFLVIGTGPNRILKFNRDGKADKLFSLRVPAPVRNIHTVITNGTGQILAVVNIGHFEQRLVRLNPDGSKDESFLEQSFTTESFSAFVLALQPDGRILVGGGGSDGEVLRRFEPSGHQDTSFSITASRPENLAFVSLIRVQSNGQIIVAGQFFTIQGTVRNRLARLNPDGTVDSTYNPGLTIFSIAPPEFFDGLIDPAGNFYLTGNFTVVEDLPRAGVVRLTRSGAMDRTFSPALGSPLVGSVWQIRDLTLDHENNLYLLPQYQSFRITNGVVDQAFGTDMILDSVREAPDRSLYVYARSIRRTSIDPRVSRLFPDGTWDKSFNPPGPNGTIRKVRVLPSGDVLIAGEFRQKEDYFHSFPRSGLAMLHADGSLNTNFNVPFDRVYDMDVDTNGHVFVIAEDSSVLSEPYLARVNLEGPPEIITFQPRDTFNSYLRSLLVLRSGKVLVSGITEGSRFNPDLTLDPTWKAFLNGDQMIEAPDGSIYALHGSSVARISAEGEHDPAFNAPGFGRRSSFPLPTPGTDGIEPAHLTSLALSAEGKLYVTGDFTIVGTNRYTGSVARLNQDGSLDRLYPIYGGGHALLARPGGGAVVSVGSSLIGLDSPWTSLTNNGAIHTLALAPDGGIYAGGEFTSLGGIPSPYIARLWADNLPRLAISVNDADSLTLTLSAPSGSTVLLEKSSDLHTWTVVQRTSDFSGQATVALPSEAVSNLFFRARLESVK